MSSAKPNSLNLGSWFSACASLSLSGIGVFCFVLLLFNWRLNLAHRELASALVPSPIAFGTANRALAVLNGGRNSSLFHLFRIGSPPVVENHLIDSLFQTLLFLDGTESDKVLNQVRTVLVLISNSDAFSSLPALPRTKRIFSDVIQSSQYVSERSSHADGMRRVLGAVFDEHRLLAQDFADSLSLTVEQRTFNQDAAELPAYKSGIFAGLPLLGGLRDDIEDLAILKEELTALRGSVRVSGDNQYQAFQDKLATLRSASSDIAARYNEAFTALGQARNELVTAQGSLQRSFETLRSEVIALLLDLTGTGKFMLALNFEKINIFN